MFSRSTLTRLAVSTLCVPVLAVLLGARSGDETVIVEPSRSTSSVRGNGPVETPRLDFSVSGQGGERAYFVIPVRTDDQLRVRVEAGPGQLLRNPQVWNFSAPFRCVRFTVSALGRAVTTDVLRAPGSEGLGGDTDDCKDAPSFQDIDFSALITPHHGPVNVEVSAAGYDFFCQSCNANPALFNAINGCNVYCPLNPVDKTHLIGGSVTLLLSGANAGVLNPPSGL